MNAVPAPLYLTLAVLCAAYLGLALSDKRAGVARLAYATVSFLLLLCGQAVLSYDGNRSGPPSEPRTALALQRTATAELGAWLAVMAAGELARAILTRRPGVEALGPVTLLLAGGQLFDAGIGSGVGLGLAAAALAAVGVWGRPGGVIGGAGPAPPDAPSP